MSGNDQRIKKVRFGARYCNDAPNTDFLRGPSVVVAERPESHYQENQCPLLFLTVEPVVGTQTALITM
jgi:hypothetical protein